MTAIGSDVRASRKSLMAVLDSYLDALRRKDTSRLDLTRLTKFTENGQPLPIGQGLWTSVDEVAEEPFSLVVDEHAGTVVALTWVYEADKPLVLATRIATLGEQISELETVVSRGTIGPGTALTIAPESFERRAVFYEDLPLENRVARQELALAATLYLDAIERGDGTIIPVTDECVRYENGLKMTRNPTGAGFPPEMVNQTTAGSSMTRRDILSMTVAQQMHDSIISKVVARVRDRRFAAIDEVRGTVAIFFLFDHRQNVHDPRRRATIAHPNCCYAGELFKVADGRITHIEAGFELVPYGTRSGWES